MNSSHETLAARIEARFAGQVTRIHSICGELTYELGKDDLLAVATVRASGGFAARHLGHAGAPIAV